MPGNSRTQKPKKSKPTKVRSKTPASKVTPKIDRIPWKKPGTSLEEPVLAALI